MWFLPLQPDSKTGYKNHISNSLSLGKGFIYFTSVWLRHRRRSRGAAVSVAPSNKKLGRAEPPTFWAEKHFYGCIWQYLWHQLLQSAHFLSSDDSRNYQRSTMKQSRQNRLNPQLPTDALSQIDYGHTKHCEDCSCQQTTQRAFWKIFVRVCVWLSRR